MDCCRQQREARHYKPAPGTIRSCRPFLAQSGLCFVGHWWL